MFEIQQNLALSTYNSTLFQIIVIVKNLILIFMVLSDILRLYQFAINMKDIHLQMAQQWQTNKWKTDKILIKHCCARLKHKAVLFMWTENKTLRILSLFKELYYPGINEKTFSFCHITVEAKIFTDPCVVNLKDKKWI
jgi:hypothetical protein